MLSADVVGGIKAALTHTRSSAIGRGCAARRRPMHYGTLVVKVMDFTDLQAC